MKRLKLTESIEVYQRIFIFPIKYPAPNGQLKLSWSWATVTASQKHGPGDNEKSWCSIQEMAESCRPCRRWNLCSRWRKWSWKKSMAGQIWGQYSSTTKSAFEIQAQKTKKQGVLCIPQLLILCIRGNSILLLLYFIVAFSFGIF